MKRRVPRGHNRWNGRPNIIALAPDYRFWPNSDFHSRRRMSAVENSGHASPRWPHVEAPRPALSGRQVEVLGKDQEPEASGDDAGDGGVRVTQAARARSPWGSQTRNGAVASAVLVQPHALASAFWCIGTGPLRRALAGATRSGTAGVGHLLAIRGKRCAVSADVL